MQTLQGLKKVIIYSGRAVTEPKKSDDTPTLYFMIMFLERLFNSRLQVSDYGTTPFSAIFYARGTDFFYGTSCLLRKRSKPSSKLFLKIKDKSSQKIKSPELSFSEAVYLHKTILYSKFKVSKIDSQIMLEIFFPPKI